VQEREGIYVYTHIYECMYICVYVCVWVYMCICVCILRCERARHGAIQMEGVCVREDERMRESAQEGEIYVCMYVCMYMVVCMYVCMYVYIYFCLQVCMQYACIKPAKAAAPQTQPMYA